ncbi:MAG: hypothetical protein Q9157_004265 [Trypethelium eluteriae]
MVSNARIWTALVLLIPIAASSLIKRGPSVIIGYRSVNPDAVQSYQKAGNTLTYKKGSSSDQLGPGVYISPVLGDWVMGSWECAILADSDAWNKINKAWVPEIADDGCTPLWWSNGGGSGFTTDNTVLLSKIDITGQQKLQLMIPAALIGGSGGLKLQVQCVEKTNQEGLNQIGVYGNADWYSWSDVKGTPQRF